MDDKIIGLCIFELSFSLTSNNDRHVTESLEIDSYIEEEEGLYYCYAPEIGEMAYGSSINNATQRMEERISDLLGNANGSLQLSLKNLIKDDNPLIDNLAIINQVKMYFKKRTLAKVDDFRNSMDNDSLMIIGEENTLTKTLKLTIGEVKISSKLQVKKVA